MTRRKTIVVPDEIGPQPLAQPLIASVPMFSGEHAGDRDVSKPLPGTGGKLFAPRGHVFRIPPGRS
jgi:hypothetical protein